MEFGAQTGGLLCDLERPRGKTTFRHKDPEECGDLTGTRVILSRPSDPGTPDTQRARGRQGGGCACAPCRFSPALAAAGGAGRLALGWGFPSLVLRPGPRDERADSSCPPRLPQRARPVFCAPPAPGKCSRASGLSGLRLCRSHSEIVLLGLGPLLPLIFASGGPRIAESDGHSRGSSLDTQTFEGSQSGQFSRLSRESCSQPSSLSQRK